MTQHMALAAGGIRGIGLAIAGRLLDGLAVCISARKAEALDEAAATLGHPQSLLTVAGRSDDPDRRRDAADAAVERFGQFDVLANNAGINPHAAPGWAREMRRVSPGEQGAIVNIWSYATVCPSPRLGMHGASKAALIHE